MYYYSTLHVDLVVSSALPVI